MEYWKRKGENVQHCQHFLLTCIVHHDDFWSCSCIMCLTSKQQCDIKLFKLREIWQHCSCHATQVDITAFSFLK